MRALGSLNKAALRRHNSWGEKDMKTVSITIEDCLYDFYRKIGENAGGISPEQVMADTLFKLAGELSMNALHTKQQEKKK